MKRIALSLLLSVFSFLLAQAQQKQLNGRVVDAEGQAADGTLLWYK